MLAMSVFDLESALRHIQKLDVLALRIGFNRENCYALFTRQHCEALVVGG